MLLIPMCNGPIDNTFSVQKYLLSQSDNSDQEFKLFSKNKLHSKLDVKIENISSLLLKFYYLLVYLDIYLYKKCRKNKIKTSDFESSFS